MYRHKCKIILDYFKYILYNEIGDVNVNSEHLDYKNGKLTISKDAMKELPAGTYQVAFVFGNQVYTTLTDKVTLAVKGIASDQTYA